MLSITPVFRNSIILPTNELVFRHDWVKTEPEKSNCLAYALNCEEIGRRNPGDINRQEHSWLQSVPKDDPLWLMEALQRDGLELLGADSVDEIDGHLIAAFVTCFDDVHFYRRDADDTWSHKMGPLYPTNHCSAGMPILNPRQDAQRNGSVFMGYYRIPERGIPCLIYNSL